MIRQLNEAFDKLNNTNIKSNKTILESLQEAEEFEESYSDIEQVKSFLKSLIVNGRVRALKDNEKLPRGVYFKSGTGDNGVIHFKGNDYAYAIVKGELRVMPEVEAGWNWSETIYSDDFDKLQEDYDTGYDDKYDEAVDKFTSMVKEIISGDSYFNRKGDSLEDWLEELVMGEDSIFSFLEYLPGEEIIKVLSSSKSKELIKALVDAYKAGYSDESMEKALLIFDSIKDEQGIKESLSKLQEKLPADLAKAYDRNDLYKDRTSHYKYNDTDFEKAEYKEITPEEALELKKQGRITDIRAIVNGDLIRYNSEGKSIADADVRWQQRYTTRTGNKVDNTRKMPFNYVMQIADKIYVTDEDSSKIDADKLKRHDTTDDYYFTGGSDPDNYWDSTHFGDTVRASGAEDTGRHLRGYDNKRYDYKNYLDDVKEYRERLRNLQSQYDAGDISRNEYEARKTSLQKIYDLAMQNAYRTKPNKNTNSPLTVAYNKRNLNKYKALKYTIQQSLKDIDKENNKLQNLKTSSADSPEYKYERDQLAKLRAQLKSIQREIEYYEGKLSDDSIAKDTSATEAELDRLTKRQADAQKQLDDLLKR